MKKIITIFLFSIVIITMNSCKNSNKLEANNKEHTANTAPVDENWDVLNTKEFTISYPKNWKLKNLDAPNMQGIEFMISSPSDSANDKTTQNINLVKEDLDKSMDLDAYAVAAIAQINEAFLNNALEKEKKKIHGRAYYKVVFVGNGAKFQQYYFVDNNKAYVLNFTTSENDFEKDIILGEEVLNTFILK